MKKNREKTIEILSRILADAKDLIIPRDKVIRVINDLECAVNLAEESRDSEVLELIQTELVKELSQLESVYQNFYTQENVGIFRELNQAVESTMNRVSLLNENPVTHVCAKQSSEKRQVRSDGLMWTSEKKSTTDLFRCVIRQMLLFSAAAGFS